MAENMTRGDILETFIKAGLHRKDFINKVTWPKETIVVCLIVFSDNTEDFVIKSNVPQPWPQRSIHAEEVLIKYINSKLKIKKAEGPTKIKSVTLYSNNSPCIECSVQLMEANFPDLQIKFSTLYNIKRPSCARSTKCKCHEVLDKKDEETMSPPEAAIKHSERFRMLTALDAWPFQKEDWDDLIELLKENVEQKENDEHKKNYTSDLDGLRYGDKYKDWRNGEDEKMKADYQELRAQISPSKPNKNTSSRDYPSGPSKGDQATGSTGDGKSRKKLF